MFQTKTDFSRLPEDAVSHPAYDAFIEEQRIRPVPSWLIASAWNLFKKGWEDTLCSIEAKLDDLVPCPSCVGPQCGWCQGGGHVVRRRLAEIKSRIS